MVSNFSNRMARALALSLVLTSTVMAANETHKSKKVFVITDMEGVDGVFNEELQCIPFKSPRWEESRRLLTEEINAAVEGLFGGGASDVVVWDGHWEGGNLSVLDIDPRTRLLTGIPVSPTLELDTSYAALIFIGQHAMVGAQKGILCHFGYPEGFQNIWINDKLAGEIGNRTMLAGYFGIPVIMLSGDTAACKELHDLVPEAECAEVKSGVSRTAGFMLPHAAACALIREKARRAMERLPEFKPYKVDGPVEVKIEFTATGTPSSGTHSFQRGEGVEQLNERTWVFHGKDLVDAMLKAFGGF